MSDNAQNKQKMLLVIVSGPDSENVENALEKTDYIFVKLPSAGGFLRERSVTFLIGCPQDESDALKQLLDDVAGRRIGYVSPVIDNLPMGSLIPTEVQIGGVTIFDLEIEHYEEI